MPKEFDEKKIKDNNGFQFSTRVQASFDLEKAQGKYYTVQKTFKDYCILEILSYISYIRRLKNTEVTVNSVHPGIVETEITRKYYDQQMWITIFQLSKLLGLTKSPFEGAKTLINATVNPDSKVPAQYQGCVFC
nr:uncharacterized protein LOC109618440 [Crassostrea gigas]